MTMLQDEEWRECSESEIALRCRVSRALVTAVKAELELENPHHAEKQDETVRVKRRGKSYSMSLTKIRRKRGERKKPSHPLPPDITANAEPLHPLVEQYAIMSLQALQENFSQLPAAEAMAQVVDGHGVDFSATQAREIAGWFQTLSDDLDHQGQLKNAPHNQFSQVKPC